MMIRWRWPNHTRQGKPMTVGVAVGHALSDPDPEARASEMADIVGRLIVTLHNKGVLLPHEVIHVIGEHAYEEVNGADK